MDINSKPLWQSSLSEIYQLLTTSEKGLSQKEADSRLEEYGVNEISPTRESLVIFQFLRRFKSPLVILLLVTCIVALLLHQKSDFYIIMVMVFLSVGLDFIQEYSANKAAKKLRDSIALKATVLREGIVQELPVKELVPGDIVYLHAGDMIPADGRLIWSNYLYINQAILTGESFPVNKNSEEITDAIINIFNAHNYVFMGSSVVSGQAHMVVCNTGDRAYIGGVADILKQSPPVSQFEQETTKFGYFLMRITVFLVLFVLMVNLFFHRSIIETFLFALALAIGMTPEFLPMVMSVTLARGAKIMALKQVIVKRLSAIHDIGSMNILCTDKTGTLTEAKIEVAGSLDCNGKESEEVMNLAYLNSYFETGLKNPMDNAILNYKKFDVKEWKKIDEFPFDFERRRVSVILSNGTESKIIVKGAPESIIPLCTQYEEDNKIKELSSKKKEALYKLYKDNSLEGFRILALAWQQANHNHGEDHTHEERDLIFAGFALFYDPPKVEAALTLEKLKAQNVDIYIITGDSEDVTLHLCKKLNIEVKGLLLGSELSTLDESALENRLRTTNLYCRVTPSEKKQIILELKSMGNVVGFLGDGINDAPSLYSANVGISVDNAADVAKEAADLILLQSNLEVVHDAVVEGRKIYSNIIKYLMMMTSSNFGNMFSMAISSIVLPFLPMLPTQILLNNLLYDTSQTAIPFDNVDPESILRPRLWNLKFILRFMLLMGPLSSLFDFLIFFIMLKVIHTPEALFQTGWFLESLATQVLIIFVIRTRKSVFESKPSRFLAILAFIIVSLAMCLPYTPIGAYFGFVPPPFYFFLMIIGIIIIYIIAAERLKFWFYKKLAD